MLKPNVLIVYEACTVHTHTYIQQRAVLLLCIAHMLTYMHTLVGIWFLLNCCVSPSSSTSSSSSSSSPSLFATAVAVLWRWWNPTTIGNESEFVFSFKIATLLDFNTFSNRMFVYFSGGKHIFFDSLVGSNGRNIKISISFRFLKDKYQLQVNRL